MFTKKLTASEKDRLARVEKSTAKGELQYVESQIDACTREKMAGNPDLQYHEALKLVAHDRPDLDETRTILIRRLG